MSFRARRAAVRELKAAEAELAALYDETDRYRDPRDLEE